jgi:cytosine deaminase
VHAVANPLINITLQGRHDSYPKRRGMTRVPELLAAGVNVAFGHDCVMDPWYALGSGRHAGGGRDGPARGADDLAGGHAPVLRRGDGEQPPASSASPGYGLEPAAAPTSCCCRPRSPVEAIRLRATAPARGAWRRRSWRAAPAAASR